MPQIKGERNFNLRRPKLRVKPSREECVLLTHFGATVYAISISWSSFVGNGGRSDVTKRTKRHEWEMFENRAEIQQTTSNLPTGIKWN